MTSFNHYALGAVADWLHRRVAGLAPAAAGYRAITVDPVLSEGLTRASARHITPYGEASVAWERSGGRLRLDVRVPVGASADVHVPGTPGMVHVGHGEHWWEVQDPICGREVRRPEWSSATVRDLIDDPLTWCQVIKAATQTGIVQDDAQAARLLAPYLDAPATQAAHALAPDDRFPGAHALRVQIADILGGPHPDLPLYQPAP
jgi:alpha-L-rhamnosidase